jgi:hypothetical protein
MEIGSLVKIFTGIFLITTLVIAFIVRMKLGYTKSEDSGISRKMRRNTLLTIVIVMIFLGYWIRTILSGRLIEEGIVGWKVYALMFLLLMGLSSLFFLLYGQFKKK